MAIRLRVSIALIVGVTLLFILSASFVPHTNDDDSAIGRGIRKGTDYLKPSTLIPAAKEILGLNQTEQVPSQHLPPQPDPNFRLLIGIMSPFWSSARRQMVRNAYNRFPKDLPVDIVFVKGNMPIYNQRNAHKVLAMERNVTEWENNTFHDIMHLDCEEAIEYGKTYEFFKKIGTDLSHKYTHVMKTDDDSFVNIPGTFSLPIPTLTARPSRGNSQAQWTTPSLLGHNIQSSKRTERDVGIGIHSWHGSSYLDLRV